MLLAFLKNISDSKKELESDSKFSVHFLLKLWNFVIFVLRLYL